TVGSTAGTPTGTVTFFDGANQLGTGSLTGGTATFSTSVLIVGSHSITASYAAAGSFGGSTSSAITQTVNAAATTTSVTGTPNPSNFGDSVTFTATVGSTAGSPTGTVTFFDGANQIGTGSLTGGTATFSTPTLAVGPHTITASYGAAGNFAGSTSSAFSLTVDAAATTTSVVGSPSPSSFGGPVTFTATVGSTAGTPTGTVTFFDGANQIGTGSLAGGTAIFITGSLAVGSHSITASYGAAGNFAGSTSSAFTQTVNLASTSTTLIANPNPVSFGSNVTFTATVTSPAGSPTGTVTFFDGATQLGTGSLSGGAATFSTSKLATGMHSIKATYGNNGNFAGSTSPIGLLTVNGVTTTVAISSTLNPAFYSQSVVITATVAGASGTPTGEVDFYDGASLLGSGTLATVAGQQQVTFSSSAYDVGTHAITAKYVGTGSFNPATSPTLNQVVNSVGTTTALVSSLNPAPVGQLITFTATIDTAVVVPGAPTGMVTFMDGATTLGTGTVTGGVATFQTGALTAGNHTITASYGGDAGFDTSASTGVTQVVSISNPNLVGYHEFGVGAGAGAAEATTLFNPNASVRFSLNIFPGFTGGVRVASADFNGDGFADLVAGTGPGSASHVVVLDGVDQHQLFAIDPFEASFTGGVFVAAGDVNGDGVADLVISPDEGGGPRVRIFNGGNKFSQINDFFGIDDPNFRGGARTAIGDVNGDGTGDLVVAAGFGGGPRVAVFDGAQLAKASPPKLFGDFFMFEDSLRNGAYIAAGDLNGDGFADVIGGGGPGGGPRVYALSGKDLLAGNHVQEANFFAGNIDNRGGIRVSVRDLDNDTKADLVVGDGDAAGSLVTGYLGKNIPVNGDPSASTFSFEAYPGFTGGVFVG
ncbi:MAG TPA: Ig-like domain repeat protein, partial [Fimbriiglobus sp.]